MTLHDIKERLALPPNTIARNLRSRALRQHVAGGAELLNAKEWATSIANNASGALADPRRSAYRPENEARRALAEQALDKLASIETAMLAALERAKELPLGSLVDGQRAGAPE